MQIRQPKRHCNVKRNIFFQSCAHSPTIGSDSTSSVSGSSWELLIPPLIISQCYPGYFFQLSHARLCFTIQKRNFFLYIKWDEMFILRGVLFHGFYNTMCRICIERKWKFSHCQTLGLERNFLLCIAYYYKLSHYRFKVNF